MIILRNPTKDKEITLTSFNATTREYEKKTKTIKWGHIFECCFKIDKMVFYNQSVNILCRIDFPDKSISNDDFLCYEMLPYEFNNVLNYIERNEFFYVNEKIKGIFIVENFSGMLRMRPYKDFTFNLEKDQYEINTNWASLSPKEFKKELILQNKTLCDISELISNTEVK